jgi:hypothetical protein
MDEVTNPLIRCMYAEIKDRPMSATTRQVLYKLVHSADHLLGEYHEKILRMERALAAADRLAHQSRFSEFHRAYWDARGGHDACTVCVQAPSATSEPKP